MNGKPRMLDLFAGEGGAGYGYWLAGFDVVGIDIRRQPRYPFAFVQGDAMRPPVDLAAFDVIHASPPCQAHSTIAKQQRQRRPGEYEHPDLVAETRALLRATGLPYVIENVPGAPLVDPIQLCGSSLGMDVRRHRLFECNWPVMSLPCAHGLQRPRFFSSDKRRGLKAVVPVYGGGQLASVVGVHGHTNYAGEQELRQRAMEVDWMSSYGLTQAIPPRMTEFLGTQLLEHLNRTSLTKNSR